MLFVAEKMAALSVVHHRLVRSGLRDVCLELHSRSANKKALAQELGRTLMASASAVPNVADAGALRQDRDTLNRISDLLHKPSGPAGDTPFRAMAEIIGLIGKGAQPPSIPLDNLDKLSLSQRRTAAQAITRFVEALAAIGAPEAHPSRSARVGPRVLKRFLDFAKTGIIEERVVTGLDADSPFEEDVARVIRGLGYEADLQVGTAGFRIDLGVRHPDRPGQYIVAVECDGAAYHSALWARERDRLRQDVLESLGWRFHRIWSTDWFHRREHEIRRLADALAKAKDASADGISVRGANTGGFIVPVVDFDAPPEAIEIGHLELTAPAYVRAELTVRASVEPHEAPQGQIGDLIVRIVDIEGPIHVDELARRIAAAFGKTRTGARIVDTTMRALQAVQKRSDNRLRRVGQFVLNEEQLATPPVRDRRAETGALLKAEYLPPMEISAAAAQIRAESGLMPPEEMTRAVARILGFQRVGPDLSETILTIIMAE